MMNNIYIIMIAVRSFVPYDSVFAYDLLFYSTPLWLMTWFVDMVIVEKRWCSLDDKNVIWNTKIYNPRMNIKLLFYRLYSRLSFLS